MKIKDIMESPVRLVVSFDNLLASPDKNKRYFDWANSHKFEVFSDNAETKIIKFFEAVNNKNMEILLQIRKKDNIIIAMSQAHYVTFDSRNLPYHKMIWRLKSDDLSRNGIADILNYYFDSSGYIIDNKITTAGEHFIKSIINNKVNIGYSLYDVNINDTTDEIKINSKYSKPDSLENWINDRIGFGVQYEHHVFLLIN